LFIAHHKDLLILRQIYNFTHKNPCKLKKKKINLIESVLHNIIAHSFNKIFNHEKFKI